MQALLDEDSTLSKKRTTEMLDVTQQSISKCLHVMGKIQKKGKWIPYELKERGIERRKTICKMLFQRQKRKVSYIGLLLEIKR